MTEASTQQSSAARALRGRWALPRPVLTAIGIALAWSIPGYLWVTGLHFRAAGGRQVRDAPPNVDHALGWGLWAGLVLAGLFASLLTAGLIVDSARPAERVTRKRAHQALWTLLLMEATTVLVTVAVLTAVANGLVMT